jgi:acetyl esterase/lipase
MPVDADRDALRASGDAFRRELLGAGVSVSYSVVPGSRHGFLDRPRRPAFAAGVAVIVDRLSSQEAPRAARDARGPVRPTLVPERGVGRFAPR